jgi:prepilin-type N-terminal cleavage/methylation domain-containing protein/prepilin-type processing-associated H-X9-DG protein
MVMRHSNTQGYTLVELLTVIAIIALVIQMLLPAVQAAREAARRAQCADHLRQLGLAAAMHEQTHRFYPTGGWGWCWMADPDRGYGRTQPGGWVYSVLPYIEQDDLRRLGAGLAPPEKQAAIGTLVTTPIALLMCPSRRAAVVYPFTSPDLAVNYAGTHAMIKTDYAMNAGSNETIERKGPKSFDDAIGKYDWPVSKLNGIAYQASETRAADVTDGLSNTLLVGEKYLNAAAYTTGMDKGDNESPYVGTNNDTLRSTHGKYPLTRDKPATEWLFSFGSIHSGGCQFTFCDGSVRPIDYDIDPGVYRLLGSRNDGEPIDAREVGR